MKGKISILYISLLVLQSCEMFESHPYDGKVSGETNVNDKNIKLIEGECKGKTTLRFAFISDTQHWYDEVQDFVEAVNKRNDIDFVIHGGDVSEYSMTREFLWIRDLMDGLDVPNVTLLGNHDCLATGIDVYRRVFGPENFSFLAGDTKFICLNTNSLEFDYSKTVPDMDFMRKQANDTRAAYEKTVVVMHASPLSEQFDDARASDFQSLIKNYKGLQFCMNGHEHGLYVIDLFEDGLLYFNVSSIEKRKYLLFTLKPNNEFDYETVTF